MTDGDVTRVGTVEMKARDGEKLIPDAPKKERTEVILRAASFDQILNLRAIQARLEEDGVKIASKIAPRRGGDIFELDTDDLPRLLGAGAVELVGDAEERERIEKKIAEIEAERGQLEIEIRQKRQEVIDQANARLEETPDVLYR